MTSEIPEIENRKNKHWKSVNETKSSFFEKVNKIDKPLAKLMDKKQANLRFLRM